MILLSLGICSLLLFLVSASSHSSEDDFCRFLADFSPSCFEDALLAKMTRKLMTLWIMLLTLLWVTDGIKGSLSIILFFPLLIIFFLVSDQENHPNTCIKKEKEIIFNGIRRSEVYFIVWPLQQVMPKKEEVTLINQEGSLMFQTGQEISLSFFIWRLTPFLSE